MKSQTTNRILSSIKVLSALAGVSLVTSCQHRDSNQIQGYVEGEFVYVASPYGGALETLSVARGTQVKAGDPLFVLESGLEKAAMEEAGQRLSQARANLEDAKKGKRPSEIQAIETQLQQAVVASEFAAKEWTRLNQASEVPGAVSLQDLDRAGSNRDQAQQRVAELKAELETARLGARTDQVAAAEANVRAAEAALGQARWTLEQKTQAAPEAGLIYDTLYRIGEWVAAGRPVVALLPPQHLKVRAFVPEPRLGAVQIGDEVRVKVDGLAEPFAGKISFISPAAEFTPPVIYSRESRDKLVFMIEVQFDPAAAVKLHPGQPVDVELAR